MTLASLAGLSVQAPPPVRDDASPPVYREGAAVTLVGLKTQALNGQSGVVVKELSAATGRIGVKLGSRRIIAVKPANLKRLQPDWWPAPPAPPVSYAPGDRVVVTAGAEKGRHGRVILVKFEDNGVIPDRDQVVQRNKMLAGRVAVRLDTKQDLHVVARDSLEPEPDLADLRRPYTPEERAKYGNRSTPQEREMARTYQLVEQTKNLWATGPVDFPAELKAYLRAGRPAPLMQRCLDAIPLLMQGAMPQLDARGMLTVKSISPHAPPTWTMDVPPWIPPSCGGGMKAYPEYERAMDVSVARRKKGLRPLN